MNLNLDLDCDCEIYSAMGHEMNQEKTISQQAIMRHILSFDIRIAWVNIKCATNAPNTERD